MREGHRANALLVELLLVILFFMLGSTTLVQIFADAKHKSMQARAMNVAICSRVTGLSGANLFPPTPEVISFSCAHAT